MERELKESFIRKMKRIEKTKGIEIKNIDELFRKQRKGR